MLQQQVAQGKLMNRCMQAARLVTAEQAQAEYERSHKKEKQKPDGALYYNPKALYKVYKKRTGNVPYTLARPWLLHDQLVT